ncbi:MAG: DUF481 domain-containing protein [Planctomycetota bacterium]
MHACQTRHARSTALLAATLALPAALVSMNAGQASADDLLLDTGEILRGEIIEQTADTVVLDHPLLGVQTIERAKVLHITASEDAPEELPKPAPERRPLLPWFLPQFDRQVEVGLSGSEGNSQSFNLNAAASAKFEDDVTRWDLAAHYFRSKSDGEIENNEGGFDAIRDFLFPEERHFYFGKFFYDYDQLESFEHRVGLQAGVGYDFYKLEDFKLNGRVGGGPQYEFGDVNELTVEALIGVALTWIPKEGHTIEFSNDFFPSITRGGEYRNITAASYAIELDAARGVSFKVGAENEYESDPGPGDERNDVTYFARLVVAY